MPGPFGFFVQSLHDSYERFNNAEKGSIQVQDSVEPGEDQQRGPTEVSQGIPHCKTHHNSADSRKKCMPGTSREPHRGEQPEFPSVACRRYRSSGQEGARVWSVEYLKYSAMKQWLYELFKVAEIKYSTKLMAEQYKLLGPDGKLINKWFVRQYRRLTHVHW